MRQALRRIEQPLQLPGRIERALQLVVECGGGAHRHRFAEQDVNLREAPCLFAQERLVESHQAAAARRQQDVVKQSQRRQRFGDDAQRPAGSHDLPHQRNVMVQAVEVDHQARARRTVPAQLGVERRKIGIVGRAAILRPYACWHHASLEWMNRWRRIAGAKRNSTQRTAAMHKISMITACCQPNRFLMRSNSTVIASTPAFPTVQNSPAAMPACDLGTASSITVSDKGSSGSQKKPSNAPQATPQAALPAENRGYSSSADGTRHAVITPSVLPARVASAGMIMAPTMPPATTAAIARPASSMPKPRALHTTSSQVVAALKQPCIRKLATRITSSAILLLIWNGACALALAWMAGARYCRWRTNRYVSRNSRKAATACIAMDPARWKAVNKSGDTIMASASPAKMAIAQMPVILASSRASNQSDTSTVIGVTTNGTATAMPVCASTSSQKLSITRSRLQTAIKPVPMSRDSR
ncbi:hypothetical protein CFU_0206 [Collimonas fungivorans Ter331]|uniref:Uncharacterized protein n=1 Tax=Collimonas fungivorans (strain Ter331) TaxID=1005048 RepID=G0AHK5_COLFT|nr:hypothetical protein CFU_0206 [Collimonas fungivorans Ter331]